MNHRSPFDRFFGDRRPTAFFSKREDSDNQRSPISDDTYNRIPDKFKSPDPRKDKKDKKDKNPEKKEDDFKRLTFEEFSRQTQRGGGQPPMGSGSNWSTYIFVAAVVALVFLGYRAFFSPKTTTITWTAFNQMLDDNQIETGVLTGTTLSGALRTIPKLEYWPDVIPNGKAQFEAEVERYDRAHPEEAKAYEDELAKTIEADEALLVQEKSSNSSEGSKQVCTLKLKDGSIYKSIELPADASNEQCAAARNSLVESYKLGLRLKQRWVLAPLGTNHFGLSGAVQMVDAKTGKALGKIFFKKYSCETPAFAYSDATIDARLRERLESYSSSEPTDSSSWVMMLSVLVSVLFLVFLFKMMRHTSEFMGGGFGLGAFTRSLAKRYEPNQGKRVSFADVAGMDAVKAELIEIVDYLKNPSKYERMGARVPKGTLLFGPPGTGKTLLARAVAGEAGVPFFSINGSEFIQMFVGVGASRVREIFSTAKENAPSILFIDEIDAVGRQRGAGIGGGQDEREQTLNQILSEMDGFAQNDSVMVMASTNRPDVLDPALMRPGRFDRHITVGRPSMKGRVDIFKVYLKKIPYAANVDVDKLAKTTSGFTGADIRNLVNEATLWATRNNKQQVEASDFDFAFEKISLGLKRDEIISPENKRKTAYHEAGHALVGWFIPNGSRVHKITIIPRGRALGVTWSLPDEDKLNYSKSEGKATLAQYLAGRAAELLIYSETSSGVENDLQRATELARNMVTRWGMSETIGPMSYPDSETHPFLGREMSAESHPYSEETAKAIDLEVKKIINEADALAHQILSEKRDLFEALTDALVNEEELEETRIREILGPSPKDEEDARKAKEEEDAKKAKEAENRPNLEKVFGEGSPFYSANNWVITPSSNYAVNTNKEQDGEEKDDEKKEE